MRPRPFDPSAEREPSEANPRLTLMTGSSIASRIEPLLDVAAPRDSAWLRKLLLDPGCYEAFSAIDSELYLSGREGAGPVLIASAARGEGRTTLALTLAVMTSATDRARQTLLVDADLSNGRLADMLGLTGASTGLAGYFEGLVALEKCIYPTAIPNLWVTPRGNAADGVTPLSTKSFKTFVDAVSGRYDRVVFDGPARGANSGILALAGIVKTVLVVVRYGGPTREQVASLVSELNRSGAHVLGCVLNQREFSVPGFLYGAR